MLDFVLINGQWTVCELRARCTIFIITDQSPTTEGTVALQPPMYREVKPIIVASSATVHMTMPQKTMAGHHKPAKNRTSSSIMVLGKRILFNFYMLMDTAFSMFKRYAYKVANLMILLAYNNVIRCELSSMQLWKLC